MARDTLFERIRYQIVYERAGDLASVDKELETTRRNALEDYTPKKYFSRPLVIFPYHLHGRMAQYLKDLVALKT